MSVIVTDRGFAPEDWTGGFAAPGMWRQGQGLDLASTTAPATLVDLPPAPLIRIDFPSFADGRGFTLARLLRLQGCSARLRACGHILADQYAMARRAGFDEVEIDNALARRQPGTQWLARADWRAHDYRARLRA